MSRIMIVSDFSMQFLVTKDRSTARSFPNPGHPLCGLGA